MELYVKFDDEDTDATKAEDEEVGIDRRGSRGYGCDWWSKKKMKWMISTVIIRSLSIKIDLSYPNLHVMIAAYSIHGSNCTHT